jgi:hypothetical protein
MTPSLVAETPSIIKGMQVPCETPEAVDKSTQTWAISPPPGHLGELCNADEQARQTAPIHTPHPHDVLFGRDTGTYRHAGNVQFLAWISEHKPSYRLASNNEKKTYIIREIIALVQNQNPPGRFLNCDPTNAGL